MRRLQVLCSCVVLLGSPVLAGCGEGEAASGAAVSIYVAAPLCKGARGERARTGVEAGGLRVRLVCLRSIERKGRADLATAGANARRATEDSTAVAFFEAPGPGAKFSQSIVEAANLAWIETSSGSTAMNEVLNALEERGSSSPRDAVRESLAND